MTEASQNIAGLYERHAAAFDRARGRTLFERLWLDRVLAAMPADPAVLDLGCGSGEPIASHLAASGVRLVGIDTSASLVALCRERLPNDGWHVADMRGLDLGQRFDGLLAWDSFFHLTGDDQRAMFPVFRRHALSGAALLFTSGPAAGEAIGTFEGEPLFHASLDPQEYDLLLQANGFEVVAHMPEDPNCDGHTVWLARLVD